jgi:hypothetical protein
MMLGTLTPSDIRRIAGIAGGVQENTVMRYLAGAKTRGAKRYAIEAALRALGLEGYVRPGGEVWLSLEDLELRWPPSP